MISRAMTVLSDERLAQLAAAGSDPAFAALYNRYSPSLFAYCRSITRNADDGWDALQNAMIKVLVALRRSPDRSAPVRPWLFCICHNEAIGILRRRSAAERVAGASTCTTVAGADEEALVREVVSEVVSDVQQLPTGQRAAIVMRELADLQYDEIAIALETTEGNARQLVFAARAGLRDSRAGRGLPCESVRDQLSLADGRLLRRRSVRAHLRTCDGCREYATSVRRRSAQPARSLSAWSPLAGYQLLESVFRAAGPALVQGGSSVFAPLAAKAAAATVVLAAGLGAADVATMGPSGDPAKPVAAAPQSFTAPARAPKASPSKAPVAHAAVSSPTSASTRTVAAVQRGSTTNTSTVAAGPGSVSRQLSPHAVGERRPTRAPEPQRHTQPQRDPRPEPAARESNARQQGDCDTSSSRPARDQQQQPPVQQQSAPPEQQPTTRAVAFTGHHEQQAR